MRKCFGRLLTFEVLKAANKLADDVDMAEVETQAQDYYKKALSIAMKTLELLVADAKGKGIKAISLEATDMGRPLYEKFGFVKMNHEMELPENRDI